MTDLYPIIDFAGRLLNKENPSESDTIPYDQFMRYAKTNVVTVSEQDD